MWAVDVGGEHDHDGGQDRDGGVVALEPAARLPAGGPFLLLLLLLRQGRRLHRVRIMRSSVTSSPLSVATTCPRDITTTRSHRPSSSLASERRRRPERDDRDLAQDPVELGARADINALRRLVPRTIAGSNSRAQAITTFCWLPPGNPEGHM
jgi:hypothetical protein